MADQQPRRSTRIQQRKMKHGSIRYCLCCNQSLNQIRRKEKKRSPLSDVTRNDNPSLIENPSMINNSSTNDNPTTNNNPATFDNTSTIFNPPMIESALVENTIDLTNDEDDEDDEDSEPVEQVQFDDNGIKYPSPEDETKYNCGYDYDAYNNLICTLKALGHNYKIPNPYKIPITAGILYNTLRETEWFTGDVINLYFKLCELNYKSVHAVNSYFFSSYTTRNWECLEGYYKSTNYSMFKTILFPFNVDGNHWTLYHADLEQKRLVYYDSWINENTKIDDTFVTAFYKLLRGSNKHHKMETLTVEESDWKVELGQCPQQENQYDCGVYACCTAKALSQGVEPSHTAEDMYLYRHIIAYNIFTHFHN